MPIINGIFIFPSSVHFVTFLVIRETIESGFEIENCDADDRSVRSLSSIIVISLRKMYRSTKYVGFVGPMQSTNVKKRTKDPIEAWMTVKKRIKANF